MSACKWSGCEATGPVPGRLFCSEYCNERFNLDEEIRTLREDVGRLRTGLERLMRGNDVYTVHEIMLLLYPGICDKERAS